MAHVSDEKHRGSGDLSGSGELQHVDQTQGPHPDDFGYTLDEQKAIIRRVDRRLVVTIGLMYCISLMDRINMSNANIAGMSVELNLINNRYVS